MSREYVLQPFRPPIQLQIDYAKELNEQQHAAVTAPPGPALVIAGAGSGKTRTLTYRVAFLLEQGIPPDRILLLTFTNKAAKEMMRRAGRAARGRTLQPLGRHLSFHRRPPAAPPRRAAGLSSPIFPSSTAKTPANCSRPAWRKWELTSRRPLSQGRRAADIFSLAANKDERWSGCSRRNSTTFSELAPQIATARAATRREKGRQRHGF